MNEPLHRSEDQRSYQQAIDRLKQDLETWRTRLDEVKVKASLAKLEAKDGSAETLDRFERRYAEARETLREWKESGRVEWTAATESLRAGWEQARDTYRELKARRDAP